MTSWDFPATDPIDLRVDIPAGSITVTALATGTATVTVVPCADGRRGRNSSRTPASSSTAECCP